MGVSVNGCFLCVSRVMDWQPVQSVPHLSLTDSWDQLQASCDPYQDNLTDNEWMDVLLIKSR